MSPLSERHIVSKKGLEQAEIEESSAGIGAQDGVAPEDVVLERDRENPRSPAVGCITLASLAKVRGDAVKLSPADRDLVTVGGIDRDRGFVCRVPADVSTTPRRHLPGNW